MDKEQFAKKWPLLRGQVKIHWAKLSDADLDTVQGNPEVLIGIVQERYDESRQAVELEVKKLLEQRAYVN